MSRLKQPTKLIYAAAFCAIEIRWRRLRSDDDALALRRLGDCDAEPARLYKLLEMASAMLLGVKYALAVGAAAAVVGIVAGVINTTGVGFRIGFVMT